MLLGQQHPTPYKGGMLVHSPPHTLRQGAPTDRRGRLGESPWAPSSVAVFVVATEQRVAPVLSPPTRAENVVWTPSMVTQKQILLLTVTTERRGDELTTRQPRVCCLTM